jgi:tetratricopeptide (TPR) repeat protein
MRTRIMIGLLLPALALTPRAALGAGGNRLPTPEVPRTPEEEAVELYNRGLRSRDSALRLEDKAREAPSEEKRERLEDKARRAWEGAIELFEQAVTRNPRMHEAHSALGHALRQTGQYPRSLEAYDRALALAPDYGEAIEYRAEAYLALDRVEDAKQAYLRLLDLDRELAAEVLEAIREWLAQRRADPRGVDAATLDGLGRWLEERR